MEIAILIILAVVAVTASMAWLRGRNALATARTEAAVAAEKLSSVTSALSEAQTAHSAEVARINQDNEARVAQLIADADRRLAEKLADAEAIRRAEADAAARLLQEQKEAWQRQLADERAALGERFKAIATEVMQASSRQLDQQSKTGLEAVLAPMKTSLEAFTRDFKDCYSVEHRDRLSLREGIQSLVDLNREVSAETRRLTHALKGDTRAQGQWGEMVLINILEHSGLERGRWLHEQETVTTDDNKLLRADVTIDCPQGRKIVIDSKVSLTAYLQWLEADDDDRREQLMKEHLASVDAHIRELRTKAYQDHFGVNRADFVLMFLPHEGAYLAAMSHDENLWKRAYDSRVVIVSPTHLVSVIKLVEQMWLTEDQGVNAQKIAEQATKMVDKLISTLDDFAKVGGYMEQAAASYDEAVKKMSTGRGNVLRQIEELNRLGIKAKKALPKRLQIDSGDADESEA